jgi:hypothetical protein
MRRFDHRGHAMTDEERQRTMDFILRQQAQFAVGMQRLEEQQVSLRRVVVLMARQFRSERSDLRERIAALVDAQVKSEERSSRADDRLKRTEEIAERNSKDIAALTYTVECNSGDIHALLISTERNSEAVSALTASSDRNREDIAALARVVAEMAGRRNGGGGETQ